MYPTLIYEMHIFKDVENTSWARPQMHSFQLSADAAASIVRNRTGLSNLRRCSPEQLSFLQSHLAGLNVSLRDAREAETKAHKAAEARRKKEAQEREEKRNEELKKWRLEMASKKDDRDQKPYEDRHAREENEEDSQAYDLAPPPPPMPLSTPGIFQPPNSRGRNRSAPAYEYSSIPPPPPPPPPVIYDRNPLPRSRRNHREKPATLQQESDWSLESVDLDLIPVVAKLKVKQLKTTTLGLERSDPGYYDYRRRKGNKMPRVSYQLAGSATVEFAVVYSRTVMTAVLEPRNGHGVVRYRSESDEEGESAYEFDSEEDMGEIAVGKEEGDEEEEEEDEEDDLEVID